MPALGCDVAAHRHRHGLDLDRRERLARAQAVEHEQPEHGGNQQQQRPAPRARALAVAVDLERGQLAFQVRHVRLHGYVGSSTAGVSVLVELLLPERPVVAAVGAPVVDRVADAARPQHARELVGRAGVLEGAVAGDEPDVVLRQLLQVPGIAQARHVVDGVVEVEVVVVVPVHEAAQVVDPGQAQAAPEQLRVLQQAVDGVVRAERRARRGDRDAGRLALVVDERHHLLGDVRVVHRLHVGAVARVGALVVPALVVDRVDAEELDLAAVDVVAEGRDHALPLELPLVAAARREHEHRRAPVPVDADPHLAPEPGRVPDVVLDLHPVPPREA